MRALSLLCLLLVGCDDFERSYRGIEVEEDPEGTGGQRRIVVNGGSTDDAGNSVGTGVSTGQDSGVAHADGGAPLAPDSKPPAPKADTGPAPGSCGNAFETQVFNLVNQERAKYGKAPFKCDPVAGKVAHDYSQLMCDMGQMGHNVGGTSPFQRMSKAGIQYSSAGENVAAGQSTPAQVMQSWMSSSGHRANILGSYTYIGVGYVACPNGGWGGGHYWTQDFWR